MNKYSIKELGDKELTYIELRILTYIECSKKMRIITDILNFLNHNSFLVNLNILYYIDEENQIRSENLLEKHDVPSLSIDMRDNKMRFKFWNGSKNMWAYHRDDICDFLLEGRKEFNVLFDKYEPITKVIFDMQNKFNEDILRVTYKYYPEDYDVEILYSIVFSTYIKENKMENRMMQDISNEISLLDKNLLEEASFELIYTFEEKSKCTPCEEARKNGQKKEKTKEDS